MRVLKIVLTLLLCGASVFGLSCAAKSSSAQTPQYQIATVQRGDLTVAITASGNLALSATEDLPIQLFYPSGVKGTVGDVLVEEGDFVEKGQVLVTVDKDEWDDQLSALEDQVAAKERDLLQAQINLQTAQQNLRSAQNNQVAKQLALFNAQINLDQANYNLSVAEETHYASDLIVAQADVDRLKAQLQYALDNGYSNLITRLKAELDAAEKKLNAMIQGYDPEAVAIKKKQVESAKMALSQAEEDLNVVATDIALKKEQVTLNEGKLADARKALDKARKKLADAQSKRPEIKAPFAGFITKVNVKGGDEVLNGMVAVQIADPNKFEANIMVSEMDIPRVKLGGQALARLDAMQGLSLPAKVSHISPTATIQQGVVNYKVKVEIQSLEVVRQERQQARQESIQQTTQGELPERLKQAVEGGRLTQEQAEEMMKRMQQGQGGQQRQTPTMIPEDFQLREGLTVTVSIVVEQKSDVLLVPNAAINSRGGQAYVQVLTPSGTIEEHAIQLGISNWQYTEVISGLSEGEKVIVPRATTTTPTTSQPRQSPPPMFLPPPGGPPR